MIWVNWGCCVPEGHFRGKIKEIAHGNAEDNRKGLNRFEGGSIQAALDKAKKVNRYIQSLGELFLGLAQPLADRSQLLPKLLPQS